jgi:uncharacterized protein (DUF58 family)
VTTSTHAGSQVRLRRLGTGSGGAAAALLRRVSLTVTGGVTVLLVVVGWVLARLVASKTMYLIVYACLLGVGVAWFVARRRINLEVDRSEIPTRMREGQSQQVSLRVRAKRRVSTVLVSEELHTSLGARVDIPVASLSKGSELEHEYSLNPRRRGVYSIGPTIATWSDPFGLTTHSQVLSEPTELIVHPRVETVHDRVLTRMWEDPPVRPPVSKPWPVGFEFYGMRDYVPGDDIRRVVWAQVAKTGRMLVRESEQGITDRVVIFCDNSRDRHSPGEPSETFETAIRVAASLACRHLGDGFSVSLLTSDGDQLRELRGAAARLTVLDRLAALKLTEQNPDEAIRLLSGYARTRAHMLLVTPHVHSQSAAQLRLLIERGAGVVVANVMWDESDPVALSRAAAVGASVVQIPAGASLEGAFSRAAGAGRR